MGAQGLDRLNLINGLDAEVQTLRTALAASEQDRADSWGGFWARRTTSKIAKLPTALAKSFEQPK